jgi:hypothetical protein
MGIRTWYVTTVDRPGYGPSQTTYVSLPFMVSDPDLQDAAAVEVQRRSVGTTDPFPGRLIASYVTTVGELRDLVRNRLPGRAEWDVQAQLNEQKQFSSDGTLAP